MVSEDPEDNDNIINLAEKRKQRKRRLTLGSVKDKFFGSHQGGESGPASGSRPTWFVYIQFFLLLFLVAWLMKQC